MNKNSFTEMIKASSKLIDCDLVIKNITIVDVFNKDKFIDNIGIKNGYIVGIGNYNAEQIIDGTGKFICPGLIDAHCHIESSLVTPKEYSKAALLNGITSVVCDPHEIANVLGSEGIKFMMDESSSIPFDMYFMLPSCVPGTDFENSGASLSACDLKEFYSNDKVLGLAEVMNYPAVASAEIGMVDKLYDAYAKNKIIDGHGAGLDSMMINSYRTANITTDHECISAHEAIDKIRRGMHILIREGTVAKNLKDILPAVNDSNSARFCFCTDDKHIDDLVLNGSINSSIKASINYGLRPETAIQMATLNPASLYKMKNKGAIAPGYIADFIILDDLDSFKINSVYKNGNCVVLENSLLSDDCLSNSDKISADDSNSNISSDSNNYEYSTSSRNTLNFPSLTKESFKITVPYKNIKTANIIEIIPNKLESIHLKVDLKEIPLSINKFHNEFIQDPYNDLIKISVIERHKKTGNIGLGILKGLGIKKGAVATTIAHDSHNLIIAGTNDDDMLFAAKELEKLHGGIIVVENQKILASIKLEIGGLMTNRSYREIKNDLTELHNAIEYIAPDIDFNPFLTLSFLSLPVIPEIKITDKGLFDVKAFKFIDIFE
ncbi:MAG: adenine deaminase [Clostridium sp.]|nr:adenine deaminase [Clostridium sp.]